MALPGETNLSQLLATMSPKLLEDAFVFCSIDAEISEQRKLSLIQKAKGSFVEEEGLTLILEQSIAQKADIPFDASFACITLTVHSSLEAVGLTAAVATALAKHNISANVVAAYYHDHVFVGQKDAEDALKILQTLAR